MQLTLTISVAILLGVQSYDDKDDFKFGSHKSGIWGGADENNHQTKGDMGGQQKDTVTLTTGDYGRGGSNYDTALTRDYSPCVRGCTGRTFHSWQEHTWKDNGEGTAVVGTAGTVHRPGGDALNVNSGSSTPFKPRVKARRSSGGLWDERPAISGHDSRHTTGSGASNRAAGERWANGCDPTTNPGCELLERTARPQHVKETNQEMMEAFPQNANPRTTATQSGDWGNADGTFGPDVDDNGEIGWGTHDFVDDGGHKGTYDNGAGTHTDATGPGGNRAEGSYESTDSDDWANAWAHSHLSNTWDNRRQYTKSGGKHTDPVNPDWGAYPLDAPNTEDHYRQVMSELHQNGGAQTYVWESGVVNNQGRFTNTQQELGKESQTAGDIQNVEHFSWGIVPELAMDETARYFNGETWPRTQTRYRYSFQDWGSGSRAKTHMNQIHNSGDENAPEADRDVHKYVWGDWSNASEPTAHAAVGNKPGLFANVENGGDQTVYTPRLSYSWTKRKYNELKAATENKFHEFWDESSGPAWEWGTFNHEGTPTDPTNQEEEGASHRNWNGTAKADGTTDWAAGKGPTGHALTTAIGDGKGYNTNDKYGYGDLDTKRTWRMNGARKV